jgi:hypothetical protein
VHYSSRIPHARLSIYFAGCRLRATKRDSELSPSDAFDHLGVTPWEGHMAIYWLVVKNRFLVGSR